MKEWVWRILLIWHEMSRQKFIVLNHTEVNIARKLSVSEIENKMNLVSYCKIRAT